MKMYNWLRFNICKAHYYSLITLYIIFYRSIGLKKCKQKLCFSMLKIENY
jgi:hypothetical protein